MGFYVNSKCGNLSAVVTLTKRNLSTVRLDKLTAWAKTLGTSFTVQVRQLQCHNRRHQDGDRPTTIQRLYKSQRATLGEIKDK
jgi:3,4-dihydroxy-2-butanone 4-phosphate synthase